MVAGATEIFDLNRVKFGVKVRKKFVDSKVLGVHFEVLGFVTASCESSWIRHGKVLGLKVLGFATGKFLD